MTEEFAPAVRVCGAVMNTSLAGGPAVTVIKPESVVVNAPTVARRVAVPGAWPVNTAHFASPDVTKSPATTPPVIAGIDQASAATLATKLLKASRAMAN